MTKLAKLLELPVMAAPPTHFYSLTPYNTGGQGYLWSPSSRTYTSRNSESSSGRSSPKPSTPPRQPSQKSLPLSPQHSKILSQQLNSTKEKEAQSGEVPFDTLTAERYAKPISLDTPPPTSKRHKITQAESLASALGDKYGTDEVVAEELDLNDISNRIDRALTLDEGEEVNEDCTDNTEDDETFYDCTDGLSASHANLIKDLEEPNFRHNIQPTISAPSTPTGTRKVAGILNFLHLRRTREDNMIGAKSLPAMPLNFSEKLNRSKATKTTKQSSEQNKPTRPRPTRPSRVKRGSSTRR